MNRRPSGLQLSKAVVGFLQYKAAEGLSPTTLTSYEGHLKLWISYASDVEIDEVTAQDLRAYLAWLRTDYKPRRLTGGDQPLSPKSVRNVWVTLSSFFTWASTEFDLPNPMKAVPAPRFERAPVDPFSKEDVEALLKACKFSREANTTDRRRFTMRRHTARRDQAIILTLLDTGLRASELCSLKVGDVDPFFLHDQDHVGRRAAGHAHQDHLHGTRTAARFMTVDHHRRSLTSACDKLPAVNPLQLCLHLHFFFSPPKGVSVQRTNRNLAHIRLRDTGQVS